MKPNPPAPDDPELRQLLRDAHRTPPLPPGFQGDVWRRLERAEAAPNPPWPWVWLDAWLATFRRPGIATAGLAALMLAGLWLGFRAGELPVLQAEQARYVAAVTPFHRPLP